MTKARVLGELQEICIIKKTWGGQRRNEAKKKHEIGFSEFVIDQIPNSTVKKYWEENC